MNIGHTKFRELRTFFTFVSLLFALNIIVYIYLPVDLKLSSRKRNIFAPLARAEFNFYNKFPIAIQK